MTIISTTPQSKDFPGTPGKSHKFNKSSIMVYVIPLTSLVYLINSAPGTGLE